MCQMIFVVFLAKFTILIASEVGNIIWINLFSYWLISKYISQIHKLTLSYLALRLLTLCLLHFSAAWVLCFSLPITFLIMWHVKIKIIQLCSLITFHSSHFYTCASAKRNYLKSLNAPWK